MTERTSNRFAGKRGQQVSGVGELSILVNGVRAHDAREPNRLRAAMRLSDALANHVRGTARVALSDRRRMGTGLARSTP